jgi:hypothetical protein
MKIYLAGGFSVSNKTGRERVNISFSYMAKVVQFLF